MNQAIKQQWLAALRSGDYEQGQGKLNKAGKFCCLGVLCDLAVAQGVAQWNASPAFDELRADEEGWLLPRSVIEWAGLHNRHPRIGNEFSPGLADYNDGIDVDHPYSFAEIADLIETHL